MLDVSYLTLRLSCRLFFFILSYLTREMRVLKRPGVGKDERELGADFTSFLPPRPADAHGTRQEVARQVPDYSADLNTGR